MALESEFVKQIRIPIHGYVGVTKEELKIIELPVFQRLRDISQLSFVDRVYPDAVHKRFSHSLGVMHLCGEYGKRFQELSVFSRENDEKVKLLRLAGLLHDIGHGPYSHAFEPVTADFILQDGKTKDAHVRFGCQHIIMNEAYEIQTILGKERAESVAALVSENYEKAGFSKVVGNALTGLFSADRLDYLFRDAYHAGTIEYGIVDIERVIRSLEVHEDDIYYLKKGAYSLEGVIFAYLYMYRALYYHHAARAACALFLKIAYEAFENEMITPDEMLTPDKYVNFTDGECVSKILTYENNQGCPLNRDKIDRVKDLTIRLLRRDLPKCLLTEADFREFTSLRSRIYHQAESSYEAKRRLEDKTRELSEFEDVLIDTPLLMPYPLPLQGEEPLILLSAGPPIKSQKLSEFSHHLQGLWGVAGEIPRVYVFLSEEQKSAYNRDKEKFKEEKIDNLRRALDKACD